MKSEKEIYSKARTGARKIPSVFCIFAISLFASFICGCSDFLSPVESTPSPTEYQFNYWLLQKTYLFEDELDKLDPDGDSVQTLYENLDDPYTRYVPPSNSETAVTQLNTSIIEGDIGLEYAVDVNVSEYPLTIYRVYPGSPASKANVPRYGTIKSINEIQILKISDYTLYDSVLTHSKEITLEIAYNGETKKYEMEKETIYAPTIFIDTLNGITFVTIKSFKLNTYDQENGTYGELKAYLDSTRNEKGVRVLDLRNNPGGHVSQCVNMADLFVKEGPLSIKHWRTLDSDGSSIHKRDTVIAKSGDSGEKGKFVMLINGNSASCAEIFAAAISEQAPIPVLGSKSYGKGIGQTTWKTKDNGLAIITSLEFLTPKSNSYHKIGIIPQFPCENESVYDCIENASQEYFGMSAINKKALSKKALTRTLDYYRTKISRQVSEFGEALETGDTNLYNNP